MPDRRPHPVNHLRPFDRLNYPAKIEALRAIDVEIPDVVQELVIDPRNAVEHGYKAPNQDAARHSVGVADLFLRATQPEYERASIVAVAWNAMGSYSLGGGRESVQFREFNTPPMLFVDVFDFPATAKIVDPSHQEIRSAELQTFTPAEATTLARVLRANYAPSSSRSISGYGASYYREMKRQGGF